MRSTTIDKLDHSQLSSLLAQRDWGGDVIATEKAGEGNMNIVIRVITTVDSFILKQSVPYVNKYPDIPAPTSRIDSEFAFYQALMGNEQVPAPHVFAFDKLHHLMKMEDLGPGNDLTSIYNQRNIPGKDVQMLVSILAHIHSCNVPANYPQNIELRRLNHQHIFVLPFTENGFDLNTLQPGLQDLANEFNSASYPVISHIGEQYLRAGNTLLHGDYFPGSWLQTASGVFIIDPEFTFAGFAEFDLGVLCAHLVMTTSNPAIVHDMLSHYNRKADTKLVQQVAAIEIARRLIGLAQLPLERNIEEKRKLLQIASGWLS